MIFPPNSPDHSTASRGAGAPVDMLVANTCLPEWTVLRGGGYHDLAEFLDDARHDDNNGGFTGGMAITPTRLFMRSIRDESSVESNRKYGRPVIGGVEQTFPAGPVAGVTEAWQASAARHGIGRLTSFAGRSVLNAGLVSVMPERHQSLSAIERISQLFGGLPAVVDGGHRHNGKLADFSDLQFDGAYTQLSPEVWRASAGDEHYRSFHDSLHARGINGVVISTHHMTRGAADTPQYRLDTEAIFRGIGREGTLIGGIHVEVGRVDTRHKVDRVRTMNEARALLSGDPDSFAKSQTAELIARACQAYTTQRTSPDLPETRQIERSSNAVRVTGQTTARVDRGELIRSLRVYERALDQDAIEQQYRRELAAWQASHAAESRLPVTIEIPYAGLTAHKGRRLSLQDTAITLGNAANTVRAYIGSLV